MPIPAAALVALVVGAVAGAFNGFLVTVVGLPSLAVTIGTLALYRGLAVGLLGTKAVTEFDEFWTDVAKSKIPGTPIPSVVILVAVLAILFAILLHFTTFGRGCVRDRPQHRGRPVLGGSASSAPSSSCSCWPA